MRRHFFFRVNNAPTYQGDGNGGGFFRRMSKYSVKGVPDFILIRNDGKFIGLEMKRPSGKMSEDQELFQQKCKEKNAEYYVITGTDDLIKIGL